MRYLILIMIVMTTGCAGQRSNARLGPGQENAATLGTDFNATVPGRMVPTPYPGVDLARKPTSIDREAYSGCDGRRLH